MCIAKSEEDTGSTEYTTYKNSLSSLNCRSDGLETDTVCLIHKQNFDNCCMNRKYQNNRSGRPYSVHLLQCSNRLFGCCRHAFYYRTRNTPRRRTRGSTRPTTQKRTEQTEVSCSSSRASSWFWSLKHSSEHSSSPATVVSQTQTEAGALSLFSIFFIVQFLSVGGTR